MVVGDPECSVGIVQNDMSLSSTVGWSWCAR